MGGGRRKGWENRILSRKKKKMPANPSTFEEVQLFQNGWSVLARDEAFLSFFCFIIFIYLFIFKEIVGAPGWLSRLSIRLRLRS